MKPIKHRPLIVSDLEYVYFGVEPKNHQRFIELKDAIIGNSKFKERTDDKIILECFSLLHDINLEDALHYINMQRETVPNVLIYFKKVGGYDFKAEPYMDPSTKVEYVQNNGFDDMLNVIIRKTIKDDRMGKIKNGTICLIYLIKAMRVWLIEREKAKQFIKWQVYVIAAYIAANAFNYFEGRALDDKSKPEEYYQTAKDALKEYTDFDSKYFMSFTRPTHHQKNK